jgi:hypothetical protein
VLHSRIREAVNASKSPPNDLNGFVDYLDLVPLYEISEAENINVSDDAVLVSGARRCGAAARDHSQFAIRPRLVEDCGSGAFTASHLKIELESGRSIRIAHLVQWETYAGLLCGRPMSESNDERLAKLRDEARKLVGDLCVPVVIQPERKTTPSGEWLPKVSCIAVFNSTALARTDSEPYSSLAIAWLQDEFALPIAPAVMGELRRIDWEALAADWCW